MNRKLFLALFVLALAADVPFLVRAFQAADSPDRPQESFPKPDNILLSAQEREPSDSSAPDERQGVFFNAPEGLFSGSPIRGREVFLRKCARCHTIGRGVRVGPDLKNITAKGPREYLFHFIMDPGKFIEEHHPIAEQLLKHYGIKMPNVGLNEQQALDVFAYLKAAPSR